jgi:hypothetical protein
MVSQDRKLWSSCPVTWMADRQSTVRPVDEMWAEPLSNTIHCMYFGKEFKNSKVWSTDFIYLQYRWKFPLLFDPNIILSSWILAK